MKYIRVKALNEISDRLSNLLSEKIKGFEEIFDVYREEDFIVINYPHYLDREEYREEIAAMADKAIGEAHDFLSEQEEYENPFFYVTDYAIKIQEV